MYPLACWILVMPCLDFGLCSRQFNPSNPSADQLVTSTPHLTYKSRGEASWAIIVDIIHSCGVSGEYAETVLPGNLLPMLVELQDLQAVQPR